MFSLSNDQVCYTIQPFVNNLVVTGRRNHKTAEEFLDKAEKTCRNICEDDAQDLLALIKDAIEKTLDGKKLDLEAAMLKAEDLEFLYAIKTADLKSHMKTELKQMAKRLGVAKTSLMTKVDLIGAIEKAL